MTHYLVQAYPDHASLPDLRERLLEEEIEELEPFGRELQACLERARLDPQTGKAVWEEQDHCTPPLAMEREAVLDEHFDDIEVEEVEPGEGWETIEELPSLWWDPVEADEREPATGEGDPETGSPEPGPEP